MRIAHVIGIFSPEHGGPVVSCRNYALSQARLGHEVSLYTLEGYAETSPALRLGEEVTQHVFRVNAPAKLGWSRRLRRLLLAAEPADVYHLHGIWLRAMYYGRLKARKERKPYLVEINGALDPLELASKPWRKRLVSWWYQDRLLREAGCIHVNSSREARHVRELGFDQPIAIIPAGFNSREMALLLEKAKAAPPSWGPMLQNAKVLLYLARVHPAKGIDLLLEAWRRLGARAAGWKLVIVGPGDSREVAKWRKDYHDLEASGRCLWLGLVSDQDRAWIYDRSSVYVLPSRKENFGNTIQEAMGQAIPVITTTETPWQDIEEWECGWLCRPEVDDLCSAVARAIETGPEILAAMGRRGRAIINDRYSLEAVVDRQIEVYRWLSGGPFPTWVMRSNET